MILSAHWGIPPRYCCLGGFPVVSHMFLPYCYICQLETIYPWYVGGVSLFIRGSEMFMIS
jgi:hypothetical protein